MGKKRIQKILYYLLHAVGFLLLYLVLRDFNWTGFGELFSLFRWYDFAMGLGLLGLVYVTKALRWQRINTAFGIKAGYGTTLSFFLVSGFLSVITPGRLGEFAKIWFIQKHTGSSLVKSTSSVVLDRVWDVLILSLLGGLSLLMVFGGFQVNTLTLVLVILFFMGALLIILVPGILFKPLLFLFRKKKAFNMDLEQIYQDWKSNAVRLFLPGFFLTLVSFLILALIPVIFIGRLNGEVGFIPVVSAVSLSNILAFLPVSVAGFGTRELVFSEVWQLLGKSTEMAITISTAYFICNHLGSILLGGLTYLFRFRTSFKVKDFRSSESAN